MVFRIHAHIFMLLQVESLQRQLKVTCAVKQKKRFKITLGHKNHHVVQESSATDNRALQQQIKELQSELENINMTLDEKKKVALGDLTGGAKHKGKNDSRGSLDLGNDKRNSDGKSRLFRNLKSDRTEGQMQRSSEQPTQGQSEGQIERLGRHSWDEGTKEPGTPELQSSPLITPRGRAYTAPDDHRGRLSAPASDKDIDPAVMAEISVTRALAFLTPASYSASAP